MADIESLRRDINEITNRAKSTIVFDKQKEFKEGIKEIESTYGDTYTTDALNEKLGEYKRNKLDEITNQLNQFDDKSQKLVDKTDSRIGGIESELSTAMDPRSNKQGWLTSVPTRWTPADTNTSLPIASAFAVKSICGHCWAKPGSSSMRCSEGLTDSRSDAASGPSSLPLTASACLTSRRHQLPEARQQRTQPRLSHRSYRFSCRSFRLGAWEARITVAR